MSQIVRANDTRKLDVWIECRKREGANRWELAQLRRSGSSASVVQRFPQDAADNTGAFAKALVEVAQVDADDTAPGAACTYALGAWRDEENLGRYTFRCTGRARDAHDAGPEEDASTVGLVAQIMRHNEATMRLRTSVAVEVADGFAALNRERGAELERCYKRIETLEKKLDEIAGLRGELADRKAENDRADREQRARTATTAKLIAGALAVVPLLLRKRMGEAVDPEVLTFILSLEPEQLPALAGALKPAQQIALTALLKKYLPETPGDGAGPQNERDLS